MNVSPLPRRRRGRPRSSGGFAVLEADAQLYAAAVSSSDRAIVKRIAERLYPGLEGAVERVRKLLSRHRVERLDWRTTALVNRALARSRELEVELDQVLAASPLDVNAALLAHARAQAIHDALVEVASLMPAIVQRSLERVREACG